MPYVRLLRSYSTRESAIVASGAAAGVLTGRLAAGVPLDSGVDPILVPLAAGVCLGVIGWYTVYLSRRRRAYALQIRAYHQLYTE